MGKRAKEKRREREARALMNAAPVVRDQERARALAGDDPLRKTRVADMVHVSATAPISAVDAELMAIHRKHLGPADPIDDAGNPATGYLAWHDFDTGRTEPMAYWLPPSVTPASIGLEETTP